MSALVISGSYFDENGDEKSYFLSIPGVASNGNIRTWIEEDSE